jgi:hypothetical protein
MVLFLEEEVSTQVGRARSGGVKMSSKYKIQIKCN